ncbi:type II secretion system F family protein [bacterium CPR1]|nr:type II secretion system F family protein [bacterium CPR1]
MDRAQNLAIGLRQLAVMMAAGIPVHRGVAFLAEQKDALRESWRRVAHGVASGKMLSRCLADEKGVFPPVLANLVAAGECTGRLHRVLASAADYFERDLWLRRRMLGAFAYPIAILVVMAAIVSLLLFYVFPMELAIYRSLKVELPSATRLLLFLLGLVFHPLVWLLVGLVGLVVWRLWSHPGVVERRDALLLELPLVGNLLTRAATVRMLDVLDMLFETGHGIDSIRLVAPLAENVILERRCLHFQRLLVDGQDLRQALDEADLFDLTVRQVLEVGLSCGFSGLVGSLARSYREDLDRALLSFTALLEPIILAITGLAVGFVVIATSLPMLHLLQAF